MNERAEAAWALLSAPLFAWGIPIAAILITAFWIVDRHARKDRP